MIRPVNENDMSAVLEVWLAASTEAHAFIEPSFWEAYVESMRTVYLPASETYGYVIDGTLVAFYSLREDNLAALFVAPGYQGYGIGKALLKDARRRRRVITLSVYQENQAACQFYLKQGFSIISEGICEHTGHREYTMCSGA